MSTPKTDTSRRAVLFGSNFADTLRDYYEAQGRPDPDAYLFTFDGKQPLDQGNVRKTYARALKGAGVRSTINLQNALGHSTATMTLNTYSHLVKDTPPMFCSSSTRCSRTPRGRSPSYRRRGSERCGRPEACAIR